jgi:hypothetical protein
MKDKNYEGFDDNGEPVAPFTSYDRELDFNNDPESEYEPETDEDWGGVDEDYDEDAELCD